MKKSLVLSFLILAPFLINAQTWERISTGYNYILKGIEFPEGQSQIGYAGGQSLTYMGDAIVIKTTDGGNSWTSVFTGTDNGIEDICFTDLNTGYIAGWSAFFAKTTNGGTTWTQQNPGSDIYYYTGVAFKDADHGIVSAQTNSAFGVWYTSDGGATWYAGSGLANTPYKLKYVTDNTYFLVTNTGEIQKSTNGGANWTTVKSGAGLLLGIDFYNSQIGIATAEDGVIYKTTDGGSTWVTQTINAGDPLWHDVAWRNQNEIVICGTPETIFRSTNAGATWTNDYPASTYDPALYEILYTNDDKAYLCGSQGYFYRKAIPLLADFSADVTTVCNGNQVHFIDLSSGSPTGWNWTFEGGTPSSSTLQNPTVTYSAPGTYNVTLEVTKGASNNSLVKEDYIMVQTNIISAPAVPSGPAMLCTGNTGQYTTTSVANAASYTWQVIPVQAGMISGTGTSVNFTASATWTGTMTMKVTGNNACGDGPWSPSLNVNVALSPAVYWLLPGGGYCEGTDGFEIKLEDSDLGVNYQLVKDGVLEGSVISGTGSELSFGLHPTGNYTVTASTASCLNEMNGTASVIEILTPETPQQPSGPANVCAGTTSTYSSNQPANSISLIWTLDPVAAGTIMPQSQTSVNILWATDFSGTATLKATGTNECGNGPASPALSVNISELPAPEVLGLNIVCSDKDYTYHCQQNNGSIYQWAITGGIITIGQGTSQITVLWGNPGSGSITVSETSANNCTGNSSDYDIAKVICEGVDYPTEFLKVYPNPASDKLFIEFHSKTSEKTELIISDVTGRTIKNIDVKKGLNKLLVDISNLPSGIYFIRSNNADYFLRSCFVKQ